MKAGRASAFAGARAYEPLDTTWVHPLNPDAGMTPMPSDPRELDAALQAGRITRRLVPYYAFRYGERGARFTSSDSAFLATLPGHSAPVVLRQIEWLAGVLSNRGMPSHLLEQHLYVLGRQLARRIPERRGDFDKLFASARALRARRSAALPERVAAPIALAFPEAAGLAPTRIAVGMGHLLVAAVADHRTGFVNAVSSVEAFFLDPAIFAPRVIEAVRATLSSAQQA